MAMDLIGLNPTEIEGRHFRRNLVSWHHMWDVISELYPDTASKVVYAYSNDGDGLNADDADYLAEQILNDLDMESSKLMDYIFCNLTQKNISVPDITDFSDLVYFLKSCGGFEIW
jgi:hypothetical protein